MKRIIVLIDAEGEPTVKTEGFAGNACKDASRFIEEALGEKTSERHTAEYHAKTPNKNTNQQGA